MHVPQDSMWRGILKTFWFSGWTKTRPSFHMLMASWGGKGLKVLPPACLDSGWSFARDFTVSRGGDEGFWILICPGCHFTIMCVRLCLCVLWSPEGETSTNNASSSTEYRHDKVGTLMETDSTHHGLHARSDAYRIIQKWTNVCASVDLLLACSCIVDNKYGASTGLEHSTVNKHSQISCSLQLWRNEDGGSWAKLQSVEEAWQTILTELLSYIRYRVQRTTNKI